MPESQLRRGTPLSRGKGTLRVLLVEDVAADAELVFDRLCLEGYALAARRVEDAEAMRHALAEQSWDLVISDYALPTFDAWQALELLQASGQDLPFIVVSGQIGEDVAVEMLKAGAHDYLLKDRLARLGSAVTAALEQRRLREENRQTHEALQRSAGLLHLVTATAADLAKLLPHLEKLFAFAQDHATKAADLSVLEATEVPLNEYCACKLQDLLAAADNFQRLGETFGLSGPPGSPDNTALLARALRETVQVLKQTKRAFKSKELGRLRRRLEQLLEQD